MADVGFRYFLHGNCFFAALSLCFNRSNENAWGYFIAPVALFLGQSTCFNWVDGAILHTFEAGIKPEKFYNHNRPWEVT